MEVEMSHPLEAFFPEAPRRERIPAEKRRTERIHVLVSPEERKVLEAMAEDRKCSVSKILRSAIDVLPNSALTRDGLKVLSTVNAKLTTLYTAALDVDATPDRFLEATASLQNLGNSLARLLHDRDSHQVR